MSAICTISINVCIRLGLYKLFEHIICIAALASHTQLEVGTVVEEVVGILYMNLSPDGVLVETQEGFAPHS